MPGCHTDEDCVAWIPEDRVVLPGDIFGWGLVPLTVNLRAETAEVLLNTYQRLIDLDPAVMIPGHGPLGDKSTLERWVEYFHWLLAECKRLVADGLTDEQIVAKVAPPDGHARLVAVREMEARRQRIEDDQAGPQGMVVSGLMAVRSGRSQPTQ